MSWKPPYTTLAVARAFVRITDVADVSDDAFLALSIGGASRSIDRATNRQFGVLDDPAERLYTPRWDRDLRRYVIEIDDLMDGTGMVVTVDGTLVTDVTLHPLNAAADGKPWTEIVLGSSTVTPCHRGSVSVVALWGWTAIPDTIQEACLLQMSRLFKRRDAPFGIAGSPDQGSEMRLLAKLDPDVALMVADYRRWWGAV